MGSGSAHSRLLKQPRDLFPPASNRLPPKVNFSAARDCLAGLGLAVWANEELTAVGVESRLIR
jgi:hypothetical protein